MYKDWAWQGFLAVEKACRRENGFTLISNVRGGSGSGSGNIQESYFFSETLKYLYLIFAEDGPWHFNYEGKNEFVFSTEGHPLKVR
jgi:mannosyl-oligosaccharide alpha-1,2-mannosidase